MKHRKTEPASAVPVNVTDDPWSRLKVLVVQPGSQRTLLPATVPEPSPSLLTVSLTVAASSTAGAATQHSRKAQSAIRAAAVRLRQESKISLRIMSAVLPVCHKRVALRSRGPWRPQSVMVLLHPNPRV